MALPHEIMRLCIFAKDSSSRLPTKDLCHQVRVLTEAEPLQLPILAGRFVRCGVNRHMGTAFDGTLIQAHLWRFAALHATILGSDLKSEVAGPGLLDLAVS